MKPLTRVQRLKAVAECSAVGHDWQILVDNGADAFNRRAVYCECTRCGQRRHLLFRPLLKLKMKEEARRNALLGLMAQERREGS